MISFIKLDALANELSKNVQAQKQFGMLKPDMDKISKATGLAAQARPHVTIETWAYYSAYAALVALAASQYNMAVLGFAPEKYVDGKAVVKLVRQALPHLDKYLDENGLSGAYAALDQLEAQLLVAISKMLDGVDEQEKDIRR